MIQLYHCVDTRSFRALWALEEMGLPYELTVMPFPPRARYPGYKDINALGTVPALLDSGVLMTESAGIVEYLVTRYGPSPLAVEVSDPAYAEWLNWVHRSDATLTFPQTLVLRYRRFEPGRAEVVADDYAKWFLARLRSVDEAIRDTDWLCAGRFTAADICVGYALLLAEHLGFAPSFAPQTAAYWTRLKQRPAFQSAAAIQRQQAPEGSKEFAS